MKKIALLLIGLLLLVFVGACSDGESAEDSAKSKIDEAAEDRSPYIPTNDVEYNNYNAAQEIYDDPSTILWCTFFPNNDVQPPVTIPIAGKLTSSTTTAFNPSEVDRDGAEGESVVPARSVDGLYHPNPPGYRYGFTPGGQYVDLTDLPSVCTTQPLEFQSQSVKVQVDQGLDTATQQAQEALDSGNNDQAQQIIEQAAGQ